jgi:hypothetical protein
VLTRPDLLLRLLGPHAREVVLDSAGATTVEERRPHHDDRDQH